MAIATGNFVGRPVPRTEAALKASGAISYTADICFPNMLHAMFVSSPIARGRIRSVDTSAAEALPGVVRVFTSETMPPLPSVPEQPDWDIMYGSSFVPMADNGIHFAGQPIGMVLAETLETAEHAATLIRYDFAEERPVVAAGLDENELDLSGEPFHELEQIWLSFVAGMLPGAVKRGDGAAALDAAEVLIEGQWHLSNNHHNPMELVAS